MRILVLAWLLYAPGASGEDRLRWLLPASQAALVGAGVADAATSYGKPELNAIVANSHSRFGVKGVAVKFSILGGCIAAQTVLDHQHRIGRRWLIVANLAAAGVTAAVAAHNTGIPRPGP